MRFKALFARKWVLAILIALVFACAGFISFAQPRQSAQAATDPFEHIGTHSGTALTATAAANDLVTGTYYLNSDLNCNLTIKANANVDLCLNGHTLTGDGGSVIKVSQGAKLNLYDCGNGQITGGDGAHGSTTSYGAGVQLEGGAEFSMYGGTITGNTMAANTNEYGGGVNVSFGAIFNMYGGTISGNSAKNGAAVSVTEKNGGTSKPSTFNMYGGTISGNTSTLGAVYVASDGEFNLYATSQVTISDNTGGNVYLDGATGTKGAGVLNVMGEIAANSKIGVTLASTVTSFGEGYAEHNEGVSPNVYFKSDDPTKQYCDFESGKLIFTAPREINLADFVSNRAWVSGQRSLGGGPVYKYVSDEDGSELYLTDPAIPDGYADGGEEQAINSVAAYTGREMTVGLAAAANAAYTVTPPDPNTNKGTEPGRYEAVVTLGVNNDAAEFVLNGADSSAAARGITIDISEDKKTATVTKVWYIVRNVVENANMLLDPVESTGGDTVEYTVTEYTFGEDCAIAMPRLKYGDDGENWASNNNVKLVLTLLKADGTEDITTPEFTRAQFANYINKSMPAGAYRLEISAAAVDTTEDGTTWWGEPVSAGAHYGALNPETYNFTVSPAAIGFDLEKDEQTGYADYEWEYKEADKRTFFDAFKSELTAHEPTFKTIVGEGYWARYNSGDDVRYYGGTFDANTVKYNLARLYNNTYLTPTELQNSISGGSNGTYKVFFQISAPNHVDLAVGADRYNYFFTVNVYQKIALPTVSNVVYTGSKNLPIIASDPRYTVTWDAADEYISGGQHYVTFTLTDWAHYRWNATSTTGDHNETVRVVFTVNKTDNSWLQSPSVLGWEYSAYDAKSNVLSAVPKYLDDGQAVRFTVTTDAAGANPVAGLDGFVATDVSAHAKLAALTCNTYYIKATVAATANYNALESTPSPFRITKLPNRWVESPTVMRWSEGAYNPEKNIIVAVPMRGEDTMTAIIRDENGTEYYNSETGLNNLKDAPAGQYSLYVSIAETANYSGLEKEMLFRVFEAEGFPWWVVLIIVLAVVLVVIIILIVLYKKDVLQIISEKMIIAMRTRADADATIAAVRAGKVSAEAERIRLEREAALAAEDAASDAEEALPEVEDEPEEAVYEPEDDDVEIPSSGGYKKAFEESSSERYTYGKTVLSKLINSPDNVQARYSEIKNALLGYKKARASMSRARESFYIGRNCYARISMRGKTLCLYIAQDPETYKDTKYNVESVLNVKSYADTPSLIRLRSDRAVRYAKELIEELAARIGAVKTERKPENYAELFKTIAQFEKKRLLSYSGRKQKIEQPTNKGDE